MDPCEIFDKETSNMLFLPYDIDTLTGMASSSGIPLTLAAKAFFFSF